jgi:hypothetical protein
MSWAIAEGWLKVGGLTLLTFGTGSQAVDAVMDSASVALADPAELVRQEGKSLPEIIGGPTSRPAPYGPERFWFARLWIYFIFTGFRPGKLRDIRAYGTDVAEAFARLIRLTAVWSIIMIGSALALAAAIIQLVLAYQ